MICLYNTNNIIQLYPLTFCYLNYFNRHCIWAKKYIYFLTKLSDEILSLWNGTCLYNSFPFIFFIHFNWNYLLFTRSIKQSYNNASCSLKILWHDSEKNVIKWNETNNIQFWNKTDRGCKRIRCSPDLEWAGKRTESEAE